MSTAFLFPGQGAQAVGMGRADFDALPAARELFERADATLGYSLSDLCFNGPAEKLDQTDKSQPALFVSSMAALEVLKSKQPEVVAGATAAAGLSLGEYSALTFAGVMSFEDALRVVAERGAAMQAAANAVPSGMLSILGKERAEVEQICIDAAPNEKGVKELLQIANLLCPGNIVVSGAKSALERAAALATERGAMKVIPLSVAGAFHTSIMQPAVERLRAVLSSVTLKKPRIPVVSNVDAVPHDDPEEIRKLLVEQVCSPVRWEDSMRYLLGNGTTTFWEIGPGRVLRGLLKRIDRKVAAEGTS